jgi:DNA-binding response OmpR family regulator
MGIFGPPKTEETNKPAVASKKILVVEDEVQLAAALELKLTQAGYKVLKAPDGQTGMNLVTTEKPDLIILDLMMPVMDGKTMLRRLRDIPEFKNLPVIVLTNAGSTDNMTEMKSLFGASDFLIKSNVSLEDILNKIKQQLFLASSPIYSNL